MAYYFDNYWYTNFAWKHESFPIWISWTARQKQKVTYWCDIWINVFIANQILDNVAQLNVDNLSKVNCMSRFVSAKICLLSFFLLPFKVMKAGWHCLLASALICTMYSIPHWTCLAMSHLSTSQRYIPTTKYIQ